MHNDQNLKDLLWLIRQHPGKDALIEAIAPMPLKRFHPGRDKQHSPESFAMHSAYHSGTLDQHDNFVAMIRGSQPDSNSIKESIEE